MKPKAPQGADGVDVVSHPDALAPDARNFLATAETRCFEFGASWFGNLASTVYSDHPSLRIYVLREQGQVTALMPMRAEKGALGWQLHALGNFYTTLYEPLLAPGSGAAALARLLKAACNDIAGLGMIQIAPMDRDGEAYRALLAGMRQAGLRPFEFFAFGNWYQPVIGSWTAYLAERTGTLRSTIKRMTKKFDGDGGRLELVTDIADLARGIAAYEKVYASSWKQPEPFPAFIPGLMRSCAAAGNLRLGLAWLEGKPIAAQLWIVCHGRAEIYKVAYDEGYKAYAPGTLLTAMLMKHAIEIDKVAEVDYLIGDDAYKKTWMSHRRERWGVIAFNPRTLAGLLGWARESAARRIKALRAAMAAREVNGEMSTPTLAAPLPAPSKAAGKPANDDLPGNGKMDMTEGAASPERPPRKQKAHRPPRPAAATVPVPVPPVDHGGESAAALASFPHVISTVPQAAELPADPHTSH